MGFLPRNGVLRHPRDHLQLHHEVRRGHQEGPVRQHRLVRRHHHVPRHRRQDAEGDHCPGSIHHEDQNHRSSPPSSRCGSPNRSTTSLGRPSSTGSVSNGFLRKPPPSCTLLSAFLLQCNVVHWSLHLYISCF